jgi:hypothetical protein
MQLRAERRRACCGFARRFRQPDRRAGDRCGFRQAGIIDVLHEAGGADMWMIERPLRAQDGAGRNHRLAQ